ncbi:response regulator [Planosporangium sp. 12N6]|uniref:response regulator n=1 Tax=Planosporangium spinosum TaxID=3402278 RepID=UPI003CEE396E
MACVVITGSDPELLVTYSDTLARSGYRVTPCPDADSALAEVRAGQPDLLVTDVAMPAGMSGLELASAVKADPAVADLPVIVLTDGWAEIDRNDLPPVARLLRRPVSAAELTEQVEAVLAHGQRHHVRVPRPHDHRTTTPTATRSPHRSTVDSDSTLDVGSDHRGHTG